MMLPMLLKMQHKCQMHNSYNTMEWHCSAAGDSNKLLASYYMQLKTLWSIRNTYAILQTTYYSFCENIQMTEGSNYIMEKLHATARKANHLVSNSKE